MTMRQFLRSWLRGFCAAAVAVDSALLMQRHRRRPSPLPSVVVSAGGGPRSLEALWDSPCPEPDRTRHVFPLAVGIEEGAAWLQLAYPRPWGHATTGHRELQVGIWLSRREDARQEGRVS
jgi:hypothetical protein